MRRIVSPKIMPTRMHSLVATAAMLLASFAFAASDKEGAKRPATPAEPGLIDWTPGSEWRNKMAREAKQVEPVARAAPPAFGRDRMIVRAKLLQRHGAGAKPPSGTPEAPGVSPPPGRAKE